MDFREFALDRTSTCNCANSLTIAAQYLRNFIGDFMDPPTGSARIFNNIGMRLCRCRSVIDVFDEGGTASDQFANCLRSFNKDLPLL